ncbi:5-hydroxytryptamine receptor 3A-like [Toxotes jaculatrix]|uniref:5-hydroxytryptamine receptor 3A-like n=1 Tax=Toxotes jaculatrix TaxID=941984 RepID=UPI001B3A858E|nr:5-hydroxytryptamine receptor 3A-like [Toxotes jaculatrix]
MMFVGLLFLLLLTAVDGQTSERVCSYQDVLNSMNLTKNNELFSMTRPVKDHTQPTNVSLDVVLYAILDVRETDQTFIPYVWIYVFWENQYISWNPKDFCGIGKVSIPADALWKPDLTIEEMVEKDKAPPSPYLTIFSSGFVIVQNDQVLVSTCRMHVYQFPFDIQSCSLSFKSVIHTSYEIRLTQTSNSAQATEESRDVMRTQYEWLFINMTITNTTTVDQYGQEQDMVIYTINMKRRSVLYIVNFILPILFFLCLDLASFLVSDSGGEKLSFKVTVLLAVTVMQLILNEILPSSSNKIPLIAVYCVGIFSLMMLSLLETIVVMYLMEKDSHQDDETDKDQSQGDDCENKQGKAKFHICFGEKKKSNPCLCGSVVSLDETPTEPLKVSSSQLTEESQGLEKLSEDLREALKTLTLFLNSKKEEGKPGYWTRMAKTINRVFFIFYATAASLFLICMFFNWNNV